jgi:6-phosphogluconolactonase
LIRGDAVVTDDPAEVAAERLAGAVGNVVLTGGSTPRSAYELAAERRADWSGITIWFTDERCVPPDHEHSNYGMVRAALLDRVAGGAPGVERMEVELGPGAGAEAYERRLREAFGDGVPELELMLVGLGPDAHVCSLFPGHDALAERDRLAVGVETPGMAPLVSRVTLTLPLVNAAREVIFLVTGDDKAGAVRQAFAGPPDPHVPGSLVRPDRGSLTLILDPAAASRLEAA